MTSTPAAKQAEKTLSAYERAKALSQCSVPNSLLLPVWIKDSNTFWYERQLSNGKEFRLVNAETASNELAFNHEVLAKALAEVLGEPVDAKNLPVNNLNGPLTTNAIEITLNPLTVNFTAFSKRWEFIDESGSLNEVEQPHVHDLVSPDGQQVAFSRDYNIWLRD